MKSLFRYEDPKELEEIDVQLWSTYGILGIKGLMRVVFDTAMSRNKR